MNAIKKFYRDHKKESYFILATFAVTIGVVWLLAGAPGTGVNEYAGRPHVPEEFTSARMRAASTARNLVDLTEEATINIESISIADENGDYAEGAASAANERKRNAEIRNNAVDLSEDLRDMANSLAQVQPPQASAVGFQAITVGIELVQRLISYSNNIQEFLLVVEARLQSGGTVGNHEQIENLIGGINADVVEVNRLNGEYRDLMREFDALTT